MLMKIGAALKAFFMTLIAFTFIFFLAFVIDLFVFGAVPGNTSPTDSTYLYFVGFAVITPFVLIIAFIMLFRDFYIRTLNRTK